MHTAHVLGVSLVVAVLALGCGDDETGDGGAGGDGTGGAGTGAAQNGGGGSQAGGGAGGDPCGCVLGGTAPVCGVDGMTYDAICGEQCVPVEIACMNECPCAAPG